MQRLRRYCIGDILNNLIRKRCYSTRNFKGFQSQGFTLDDDLPEVFVKGTGLNRKAILNRPDSLNALTSSMVSRLRKLYQSWEDNEDIGFVVIKGQGDRAFCAGGDVVNLYNLAQQGKLKDCRDFFSGTYNLVYVIGTYLKPHVALLSGTTMGGGAGISIPGTFRLATEKTVFAMPETQIGFHPDAGGSFFLSHLPGHLGEYLALTGARLNGAEMLVTGLATHYFLSARLDWIEERLETLVTDDPSVIESSLNQYADIVSPDRNSVLRRMECIDRCFARETVEEILNALEAESFGENDEWYADTIEKIKQASPISLKVSLRSIREGRFQSLDQCLDREYRTTCRVLSKEISGDFFEGIRSRLIDKDYSPKLTLCDLLDEVGVAKPDPNFGYDITKYVYATTLLQESNWMGYQSAKTNLSIATNGHCDISLAWRGTIDIIEWIRDLDSIHIG